MSDNLTETYAQFKKRVIADMAMDISKALSQVTQFDYYCVLECIRETGSVDDTLLAMETAGLYNIDLKTGHKMAKGRAGNE